MQCRGKSDCKRICEANLATRYSPPQVELQSGSETQYGLAANLGRGHAKESMNYPNNSEANSSVDRILDFDNEQIVSLQISNI
ncbi:hypothetical protein CY34DRAFT_811740 [Suillus luteus UH-Slu-Lm8-n1]|uniref:Uncharacterized protein n=1 Tax=Suillus luteus UH-Slu-Lm8-n1 TaxID=930992 RepID=A0A0D0A2M5_9AGAM|nr:hypothetical protein CY34DRAFT_811740 [Suillus luteus UH-Slu-Lm8-n1]